MIMKKTKKILIYLIIIANLFLLSSAGMALTAQEHVTRSGKSLNIIESHPQGQSLSNIHLESAGFEHNLSVIIEDSDPINNVYIADLDNNGFDEFYIITVSSGSGSYGNVVAFASNKDKSLSMINFPMIQEGDDRFAGYMGHDKFHVSHNKLIRSFPLYLSSDRNANPTGGTRQLTYVLYPGEAAWQLKIVDFSDIK